MADAIPLEIPNRALFKASEVCDLVKLQPYVLRSWEVEFPGLGVAKAAGSPRVYRRADVEQVVRIKHLLLVEGLTLAGARRKLEEEANTMMADEPQITRSRLCGGYFRRLQFFAHTRGDRNMNKRQLSRRQFNALCGAVGLSLPAAGAMIEVLSAASVVAADAPPRTVKLRNSAMVPAIGQGSGRLGQGRLRKRLRKKRCEQAYRSG